MCLCVWGTPQGLTRRLVTKLSTAARGKYGSSWAICYEVLPPEFPENPVNAVLDKLVGQLVAAYKLWPDWGLNPGLLDICQVLYGLGTSI